MSIKAQARFVGLFTGLGIPAVVWLLFDEKTLKWKILYTLYGLLVGITSYYMAMNTKKRR